ncbi:MAG: GNAT family N-acetyltransferase, partial [Candidatus Krumholzibacteria bacterium]|nr:GNAT family N-acetyltransferase [Candidatus Krumholzibacteria bacterium]
GRSLLLGALRYFRSKGLKEAALSTQENNYPALGLYRDLGFVHFNAASTFRLML